MTIRNLFILAGAILSLSLTTNQVNAQMRGGGMRGGSGMQPSGQQGQPKSTLPKDFVAASGLFVIDQEPVIEKCKIKEDQTKTEKVNQLLNQYTQQYNNLIYKLRPQIDSLEMFQHQFAENGIEDATDFVKEYLMGLVQRVKKESTPMHRQLSMGMKDILSEKEIKHWAAYYKSICVKNGFMAAQSKRNMSSQSSSHRGGSQGGGMRGGMGGGRR